MPDAVQVVMQVAGSDCGIACCTMLTGQPYRVVSERALAMFPKPHSKGLWMSDLRKLMKACGLTPGAPRPVQPEDGNLSGVLVVRLRGGHRHFVVWFEGVILNPSDGLVWSPDAYYAFKRCRPVALIPV